MRLADIFKTKKPSLDTVLQNTLCRELTDRFTREELGQVEELIIVYGKRQGDGIETYFECAGIEPAQAILNLDQLHHRIQHEGLKNYD